MVDAWVPASRQNTFRGRKSTVSQNVLAACDFDMLFTFINSGWEGSAHDNAILVDSITGVDLNFPHPSHDECHQITTCLALNVEFCVHVFDRALQTLFTCRQVLYSGCRVYEHAWISCPISFLMLSLARISWP